MTLQELSFYIKKNKVLYYIISYSRRLVPNFIFRRRLQAKLRSFYSLHRHEADAVLQRVNYYNRLNTFTALGNHAETIDDLKNNQGPKAYPFDTIEYLRYFDPGFKTNFLFGDIRHVADVPSVQKSRPVQEDVANAVLLKLDKKRHFLFLKDNKAFSSKKNILFWRGIASQEHRIRFMEMYFNHPLCDLGQVSTKSGNLDWYKPKISLPAHFDFKFILSIEGNDVATNLKWIMASNSVAVMPKAKFETWFMEGSLVAGKHYIGIKDDFSDLEEQLNFYIAHPEEALAISKNANEYIRQFKNKKQEDLVSLMVLQKYFYYTSQEKGNVEPQDVSGKRSVEYIS